SSTGTSLSLVTSAPAAVRVLSPRVVTATAAAHSAASVLLGARGTGGRKEPAERRGLRIRAEDALALLLGRARDAELPRGRVLDVALWTDHLHIMHHAAILVAENVAVIDELPGEVLRPVANDRLPEVGRVIAAHGGDG